MRDRWREGGERREGGVGRGKGRGGGRGEGGRGGFVHARGSLCRANMAYIGQSRPDCSLGFQVKDITTSNCFLLARRQRQRSDMTRRLHAPWLSVQVSRCVSLTLSPSLSRSHALTHSLSHTQTDSSSPCEKPYGSGRTILDHSLPR